MADVAIAPVTIAIPTYRREKVLLETIGSLLSLPTAAAEILVIDQTEQHEPATQEALAALHREGRIRWLQLSPPSIPRAMNAGLVEASQPIVLFVDDDIRPEPELVSSHVAAHAAHPDGLVAGRVIQPWEEGVDLSGADSFASSRRAAVKEFIGCNFSVRRDLALQLGGFDENFVRVAYRYEAEFAHRYRAQGLGIHFEPDACVHHLKVVGGGTRTFGEHLLTCRPDHTVGAYYYGLRTHTFREFVMRPFRSIATRYHLRHPWRIPASLLAEFGGMLWAMGLYLRGPKYVRAAKRQVS